MSNIEVNFQTFLPSLGTFYSYFEILKAHNFIHAIEVVDQEGSPKLKVLRINDIAPLEKVSTNYSS
jgi:hypothetical protein